MLGTWQVLLVREQTHVSQRVTVKLWRGPCRTGLSPGDHRPQDMSEERRLPGTQARGWEEQGPRRGGRCRVGGVYVKSWLSVSRENAEMQDGATGTTPDGTKLDGRGGPPPGA